MTGPREEVTRLHCIISGRVQGVCFRLDARDEARGLRLRGWVRNLPNGDVETVAEGDEAGVGRYLAWCREGPPGARVTDIQPTFEQATGEFTDFHITY